MDAVNLSHITEEPLPADPTLKPLDEPESKMSRLRTAFLELDICYPNSFPLKVIDPAAAGRLRCILGLKPLPGQQQKIPKQFVLGARTVWQWLGQLHQCLSHAKLKAHGSYLVGSSASYVAGRRPILRGLTELALACQIPPGPLHSALEWRSRRCPFPYGDVDIHVHVAGACPMSGFKALLAKLPVPAGCSIRVEGFDDDHMLIIQIEDKSSGESLDYTFYTRRSSHYIVKRDSLRVELPAEPGADSRLDYLCPEPWGWWRGHMLRLLERPEVMPTLHHCFSRIINLEGRKCLVSLDDLEERLFSIWSEKRCVPQHLAKDLNKQLKEHEPSPLGRQVNTLRLASVIAAHKLNKLLKQLNPTQLHVTGGSRFLYEAIRLLPKGSLLILELVGIVALQEAWSKPFCAKLEAHEKRLHLRLRFRGHFGKRDLLLRYDPAATIKELNAAHIDWASLRPLLHLVWSPGIEQRSCTANYQRKLGLDQGLTQQLYDLVFHDVEDKPKISHLKPSRSTSLAALMLPHCSSSSDYSTMAQLLVSEDAGSESDRLSLLHHCVEKLLDLKNFWTAADIIRRMREKQWLSQESLLSLFIRSLKLASPDLCQACQPPGLEFDWQKCKQLKQAALEARVVAALDSPKVAAEHYLELINTLKPKRVSLSVDMLKRLRPLLSEELWSANLQILWKSELDDPELCQTVTAWICRSAAEAAPLPFQEKWLLAFLADERRFVAEAENKARVIRCLAAEGVKAQKQEALLKAWRIKDPALWHGVVQAYLRSNSRQLPESLKDLAFRDPASFLNWDRVLQLADPGVVEGLLTHELKDQEPPGGRFAVAAAWLSSWPQRKPSTRLLQLLLPKLKGAKWESALKEQDAAHVLHSLMNKSKASQSLLKLCNLIMLNVQPDPDKEEFVMRSWAVLVKTLVEKQLQKQPNQPASLLSASSVRACMRLNPAGAWTQLLSKLPMQQVCPVILRIDLKTEYLAIGELISVLQASLELDPSGQQAAELDQQLGRSHSSKSYRTLQRRIACKQLEASSGKINYAVSVYARIGDSSMHECRVEESRLFSLLRLRCSDWVVGLLGSQPQQAAKLSEAFYRKLLDHALQQDLEKRAYVVLHAGPNSSFLFKDWYALTQQAALDTDLRGRLLQNATKHASLTETTSELALTLLNDMRKLARKPSAALRGFLLNLVGRLRDSARAARLWCMLNESRACTSAELWDAALKIFQGSKGPCPGQLVSYLFARVNQERRTQLLELIPQLAARWTAQQLKSDVFPFFEKQGPCPEFWELIKQNPVRQLPSCGQLVSIIGPGELDQGQKEILTYLLVRCLSEPSPALLLNSSLITLRYALPLRGVLTLRLKDLSEQSFAKPFWRSFLLYALGIDRTVKTTELKLRRSDFKEIFDYPELNDAARDVILKSARSKETRAELLLLYETAADTPSLESIEQALCVLTGPSSASGPQIDDAKIAQRRLEVTQLLTTVLYPKLSQANCDELSLILCRCVLGPITWPGNLIPGLLNCVHPLLYSTQCPQARSGLQELLARDFLYHRGDILGKHHANRLCEWVRLQWERQDLTEAARCSLVNNLYYLGELGELVSLELPLDAMLLRMGIWTNGLIDRLGEKLLIDYLDVAIDDALACKKATRTQLLAHTFVDIQRMSALRKHPGLLGIWAARIMDGLIRDCSEEELLEALPELLALHPRLRSKPSDLLRCTHRDLLIDGCTRVLARYPRALTRILDILVGNYGLQCLDPVLFYALHSQIEQAASSTASVDSQTRADCQAALFYLRLKPQEADPLLNRLLQLRAQLLETKPLFAGDIRDLLALWEQLSKQNVHRYHADFLVQATIYTYEYPDKTPEQAKQLLASTNTLMQAMYRYSLNQERREQAGRALVHCVKSQEDYFRLERALSPALVKQPRLRSEVLGLSLSALVPFLSRNPELARRAIPHAVDFVHSILSMYKHSILGPLGPIMKPTVGSAKQALTFLTMIFFREPTQMTVFENALDIVANSFIRAQIDVVTFHRVLDEMAKEVQESKEMLVSLAGTPLLNRVLNMFMRILEEKGLRGSSGNPLLCFARLFQLSLLQDESEFKKSQARLKMLARLSPQHHMKPYYPVSWLSDCINLRPDCAERYGQFLETRVGGFPHRTVKKQGMGNV